jgi:hypothetical protein
MDNAWEVFLIRSDYSFSHDNIDYTSSRDIFHPNNLDVLPPEHAEAFPEFRAGDLLISLKKLNLVAVMDPVAMKIKWWSHGPWRWQHDPDFTRDGFISVWNNNVDLLRSEIIKIDPKTGRALNDLARGEVKFYSGSMGKHQYLPNGSVLIVVPDEGRVLLASAQGVKIMEYNNLSSASGEFNGHVENAVWLPSDYFRRLPRCVR